MKVHAISRPFQINYPFPIFLSSQGDNEDILYINFPWWLMQFVIKWNVPPGDSTAWLPQWERIKIEVTLTNIVGLIFEHDSIIFQQIWVFITGNMADQAGLCLQILAIHFNSMGIYGKVWGNIWRTYLTCLHSVLSKTTVVSQSVFLYNRKYKMASVNLYSIWQFGWQQLF